MQFILFLLLFGFKTSPSVAFETPDISISDTIHDWGEIRVGASKRWWLNVSNTGDGLLVLDSLIFGIPNFYTTDSFPIEIPPFSSKDIAIWFNPQEAVGYVDTAVIFSNDPDEPFINITLIGTGVSITYNGGDIIWSLTVYGTVWRHIRSVKSIPDVNGDGFDDVVAVSENDTLYLIHGNGYETGDVLWAKKYGTCYLERGLTVVPDLNSDGIHDIILGTVWGDRKVYAISGATGDSLWVFDTHIYGGGGWVYEVSYIDDLDGDGLCEILASTGDDGQGTGPKRVFMLSGVDGTILWEAALGYAVFGVRAIGDVNNDGYPDIAAGTGDSYQSSFWLYVLSGVDGSTIWQLNLDDAVWTALSPGDLNGDSIPDVVAGLMNGKVEAFDGTNGSALWVYYAGGIVTDINVLPDVNGNGCQELLPSGAAISSFVAIDACSGNQIWVTLSQESVFSLIATGDIDGDSVEDVIGGTGFNSNYIDLLSGATGEIIWSRPSPSGAVECVYPIGDIDGNGRADVLVGTREGGIFLLADGGPSQALGENDSRTFTDLKIFPNPIRKFAHIELRVRKPQKYSFTLYDVSGRRVKVLYYGHLQSGLNNFDFNFENLHSGAYFLIMNGGNIRKVFRLIVVRN